MPADLDTTTGRIALAFLGSRENIWHRGGQEIPIEKANDTEYWIKEACAGFQVDKVPLTYRFNDEDVTPPNVMGTIRTDTGGYLGTVSNNKYHTVQPRTIFEFFQQFFRDNGLQMSTAGVLKSGKVVWAQAKLGSEFSYLVPGTKEDRIDAYVRLQTSYDGSRSTSLVGTEIRQVCSNTEDMIERSTGGRQYTTRHSQVLDTEALKCAFGFLGEQHMLTCQAWDKMAHTNVTMGTVDDYFRKVLGIDLYVPHNELDTRAANKLGQLTACYKVGPGSSNAGVLGTMFGAYNAVTHYIDFYKGTRRTGGESQILARLHSMMFGSGAALKESAREIALKYCEELA